MRVQLMAVVVGATVALSAAAIPAGAVAATSYVVANAGANSVSTFAGVPGATSNHAPTSTLAGPATRLSAPSQIARGSTGALYVANRGANSVTEYAAGSLGDAAPLRTIAGAVTGLSSPAGIAVDRTGRVYVANATSNAITEYSAAATGNVAPVATVSGAATGLATPVSLAVDSAANLFVVNQAGNSVTEYRAGASGDAAPVATLAGAATGLASPDALALSSFDDLVVANTNPAGLTTYVAGAGATGNHAPLSTIATPGVSTPAGIAVPDSVSFLVTGQGSGNVVTVSGGISGSNAGPLTGLNRPTGVLVNEPLTLNDPPARFPQLAVGQAYHEHSYAFGGAPPYTWSVASGTLPAGLTLDPTTGGISGTPTTLGTPMVVLRVTDSATPAASATNTRTYTFPGVRPAVFVANGANSLINAFPLSPLGNFSPLATFASGVGINAPAGLAFNAFGDLFVSNYGAGTITEYRGARVANPIATDSGLTTPTGIAIGPNVAVSQQAANTLSEYGYDQGTGLLLFGASHLGDISGPGTGLSAPAGVVYTGGLWWVADEGNDSLTAYSPGVYGNVAPVKTISGPLTGLAHPDGIAVDGAGTLYVANQFGPSVTEYVAGASGNLAPFRTIAGTLTTLSGPSGLDLDASGNVWVANAFASTVAMFGPGANGNVAPIGSYGGANTQIKGPTAVAVTPPLAIITKRLPRAHRHHRYRAQLRAVEGTTPYRWTIRRGHLPPGLRLSPSGLIHGRPRRAGRARFTVLLRDSSHPRLRLSRRLAIIVRRH